MTTRAVLPSPRDVQATINYIQPIGQPAYAYFHCEPPEGVPAHNLINEPHPTIIHDARGKEDSFRLDVSGFQWINHPSVEKEFLDKERIKTVYYAEVEDILKKYTGAKRVFIFEHFIRRDPQPRTDPSKWAVCGPSDYVHVDHTFSGAEQIVRQRFPSDADRLLKGRFQIINVWRPIGNNVAHYPLGVVDFRTADVDADLVPVSLIFRKSQGGMCRAKYNQGHRWHYLSDQTPDEALLIKCYDTDTDKAKLALHSAFQDKTSPVNAPHRQSIEVRALVFDRE